MSFGLGSFPLDATIPGRIVKLKSRGVLVDFGTENLAYVPQSELSLAEVQSPEEAVQLNQVREFLVVGNYDREHDYFFTDCTPETLIESDLVYEFVQHRASLERGSFVDREDLIVHTKILNVQPDGILVKVLWFLCSEHSPTISFSIRKLQMRLAWQRIRQLQNEDVTVYSRVISKGQLATVEVEGIRGFVDNIDRRKETLIVGDALPLKIVDIVEDSFSLYDFSRITQRLRLIQSSTLTKLKKLAVGQVVKGKVRSVKQYGLFIEIDGLDAFLDRAKVIPLVEHPNQMFKVNDYVKAIIAEVILERPKIWLKSCEKLT
ncbi:MAG: S1 RNA-binding domain-containing protein [Cyanobacteria bacterium P01_H01_bin.152]